MDGYYQMQQFSLLHNGSAQSWQAAYLAFHIAARLGAPLHVLLIGSTKKDKVSLAQWAAQLETGGRAAGVTIETSLLMDFSMDILKDTITSIDGLFAPHHFVPDGKTVELFLDAFSCPLWIVSQESNFREMAILVDNLIKDSHMIADVKTLSHRLQQSLSGLIAEKNLASTPKNDSPTFTWLPLSSLSRANIISSLKKHNIDLLFISAANAYVVNKLPCNCVIFPGKGNA
ncbi:MAG: hypothetical protein IH588_19360 [Anaerolineales bacterium]|nr:hypothetical protein [Anaerolineales bacterium]